MHVPPGKLLLNRSRSTNGILELEKYGNVCMLCCALELARLGLLSRFWLGYLTRGANEEQEHNASFPWANSQHSLF